MNTATPTRCDACGGALASLDVSGIEDGPFATLVANLRTYCPHCSDEQERRWQAEREAEQRFERDRGIRRRLLELPPALREHTLDTLDPAGRELPLKAAREFSTGARRGLVFTGPVGTGKTTVAAATIRDYIEHDGPRGIRWLSVPRAVALLGRDFRDDQRVETLAALTEESTVLVLDDIDKSKPSPHVAEIIFGAVDTCVTHQRPLCVTTNLLPTALAQKWPKPHGEAIASRLVGYCAIFKLSGRDRRIPLTEAA
jgi:DNA replication protein DnaC